MYKKSLVLGAAALALLVLFAFVGCSNPSSGTTEYVAQLVGDEFDYPEGTVFTNSFDELVGLLNNPAPVDTNAVTHVAFQNGAALPDDLTIPTGKIVYLNGADLDLGTTPSNIIVQPGARLVVVDISLVTADAGKLLVKGTVEIYGELVVTPNVLYTLGTPTNHPAMQVADYFEADGTIDARDTVIGTSRVVVAPGASLVLTRDDIANQYTPNRFTPPQAWAAAGQGSLSIWGPLTPSYTVAYLLEGVSPSRYRWYYIQETAGGGGGDDGKTLPSIIPEGAVITASGVIEGAVGQNLTVNGSLTATNLASTFEDITVLTVNGQLIANHASFESVETLKVSSLDNDVLPSRAVGDSAGTLRTFDTDMAYLGADSATLKKAKTIIIGNYGEFESESTAIELPEGATISLGRSSVFNSKGTTSNSFDNLTRLFIGPASDVRIASPAVTFKSLKTLTLQDSASLTANAGNAVSFLVEATPSNPPEKTQISWGLNASFNVGISPTAKLDVVLKDNSSLLNGGININTGSTFTVPAGKKLTIGNSTFVNFANLGTTAPTNAEGAPIKIDGTIELASGGTIRGPNPGVFATAPADIYKFVAFGTDGKIVLNYGSTYEFGQVIVGTPAVTHAAVPFIGTGSTNVYQWAGADDGARITLAAAGITIEDTDGAVAPAVVTSNAGYTGVADAYVFILKDQTLYLGTNVQLKAATGKGIFLAGEATTGGAQLKGPGAILVGSTTITGGSNGWQVFGADAISITQTAAATATIGIAGTGTTTIFRAGGSSAVITQAVGSGNGLTINTAVVDLAGSATSPGGSIVLIAGPNPAKLVFAGTTVGKVQLGTGTGTALSTALTAAISIGGKAIVTSVASDPVLGPTSFFVLDQKLTALGGVVNNSYLTAGTTVATPPASADVTIVSNAAFVQ